MVSSVWVLAALATVFGVVYHDCLCRFSLVVMARVFGVGLL